MRVLLMASLLLASSGLVAAQTAKPPLPPGVPSLDRAGGIPVISDGIDYRDPLVAAKLLRDGEGVAVAYDAVDDDARPFSAQSETTALAARLPARIIPIRVADEAAAWRRALAFVDRLPARVVVMLSPIEGQRAEVATALANMPERLFIVAASESAKLTAPNVLTVAALRRDPQPIPAVTADIVLAPATAAREAPGTRDRWPRTTAEAAMVAVAYFKCLDQNQLKSGADAKRAFVARAQAGTEGAAPLLELC